MTASVRKPTNPYGPALCSPETVAACMKRMERIEQSVRELTEAVQALTRSTERRTEALANLERRLVVGEASGK